MAWIYLVIAGVAEMTWMYFLKLSDGFTKKVPTTLALTAGGFSFYLLSLALVDLPVGTAYGIWTGIGSVGTVLLGILFFNEGFHAKRLLFILCIISGVVGLKIVS